MIGVILAAGVIAMIAVALRAWRKTQSATTQEAPVVMVDPKDLLFSLPTLSDGLPHGEKTERMPADAFLLHEDDWRQVEFIGLVQQYDVDAELGQLRSFISRHRKGLGFTEVYIRRSRPEGLTPLGIEIGALESLLPRTAKRRTLVVGSAPWGPSVVSGYAVEIGDDAILYVQVVGKHLAMMGLPLAWRKGASPEADALLAALGRHLQLRLVDWPAARWVQLEQNGEAAQQ
jgi:hypothetical protein